MLSATLMLIFAIVGTAAAGEWEWVGMYSFGGLNLFETITFF
jgi:hypothetical protein